MARDRCHRTRMAGVLEILEFLLRQRSLLNGGTVAPHGGIAASMQRGCLRSGVTGNYYGD